METLESSSSWLSQATLALFSAIFLCFFAIYIRSPQRTKNDTSTTSNPAAKAANASASGYPPITPLPSFNWESTDPLVFRPFKPKYHLTMGISDLNYSDLIPMDKTYLSRLELRQQLLAQYPDVVRGVNINPEDPETNIRIRDALCEWYAYVIGEYLPTRFPRMFRLVNTQSESEPESMSMSEKTGLEGSEKRGSKDKTLMLESLITGLKVPIDPEELIRSSSAPSSSSSSSDNSNSTISPKDKTKQDLLYLLDTLGTWLDEDFLILLPSPVSTTIQDPKYHLQAYTTYYPAGFDTRTKLSRSLNEIHAPVPGYASKLEKSMDRFFARLEVGRAVVRVNWSVMTKGTGLFAAFGGLHAYDPSASSSPSKGINGEGKGEKEEEEKIPVEGFNGSETFLRCERQTLHRLPKSGALLFGFHTYTYPLADVKKEGLGEELAVAIEGLEGGSVPEVYGYKRGPYWGEAVKTFLRS